MLPVFSVVLEYRMNGRNCSARPTVKPQCLYYMCILHSRHFKANSNTFIFIQLNHTSCSLLRLQLYVAIYRPDSFVLMLRYCVNLKAIRYESTSLNKIVADKLHRVIVA